MLRETIQKIKEWGSGRAEAQRILTKIESIIAGTADYHYYGIEKADIQRLREIIEK